jgi:hypothetical protein
VRLQARPAHALVCGIYQQLSPAQRAHVHGSQAALKELQMAISPWRVCARHLQDELHAAVARCAGGHRQDGKAAARAQASQEIVQALHRVSGQILSAVLGRDLH